MQSSTQLPLRDSAVTVLGGGIAGTWQALLLAKAGARVTLHERGDASMVQATSHLAGGMLAPWCEADGAEPVVTRLGIRSLALWHETMPDTPFNGSLVVAHPRDRADYDRFTRLTANHERADATRIAQLEPALEGRFRDALFFAGEGHVEPRAVLPALHACLADAGVDVAYNSAPADAKHQGPAYLDHVSWKFLEDGSVRFGAVQGEGADIISDEATGEQRDGSVLTRSQRSYGPEGVCSACCSGPERRCFVCGT